MRDRVFYVYIVASRSRTIYVGVTGNLLRRVIQHREGLCDGFTADYRCERLVWFERYGDVRFAIAREKQVKRWSRAKKVWLVGLENATWEDLSVGLG